MGKLWDIIQKFCNSVVIVALDISQKTVVVAVVLGYIIIFVWSIITLFNGLLFKIFQDLIISFITLCVCIGIALCVEERNKGGDDIGGDSNKEDDTELRKDS